MAISLRLNTRRRTIIATATRLPRYARNDKVGTRENANLQLAQSFGILNGAVIRHAESKSGGNAGNCAQPVHAQPAIVV